MAIATQGVTGYQIYNISDEIFTKDVAFKINDLTSAPTMEDISVVGIFLRIRTGGDMVFWNGTTWNIINKNNILVDANAYTDTKFNTALGAAFGGSVVPSSNPAPSVDSFYFATQAGTYTNMGGGVVSANSFAVISYKATGAVWSISQTTLNLSAYTLTGGSALTTQGLEDKVTKITTITYPVASDPSPNLNINIFAPYVVATQRIWFFGKSTKTFEKIGIFIYKPTTDGTFTHGGRIQLVHKRGSTNTVFLDRTLTAAELLPYNTNGIVGSWANYELKLDLNAPMNVQVGDTWFLITSYTDTSRSLSSSDNATLPAGEWNNGTSCFVELINPIDNSTYTTVPALPGFPTTNPQMIRFYSKNVDTQTFNVSVNLNTLNTQVAALQTKPRIILPSKIYATEGVELDLQYDCMVFGFETDSFMSSVKLNIVCTKGKKYDRRWSYTPLTADVGTTTFTLDVYDVNSVLIATKTVSLVTRAKTGLGAAKNILKIGDSRNEDQNTIQQIRTQFQGLTGGTLPTFVGTSGTTPYLREAHGGWTYLKYTTPGSLMYVFTVSGTTSLVRFANYTNNGHNYQIERINVTAGSGTITCYGDGTPSASGTLTRTAGTGDATVAFSAVIAEAENPLVKLSTGLIDIPYYRGKIGLTSGTINVLDVVLGVNDMQLSGAFVTSAQITTVINQAKALFAAFLADNPAIKIIINLPTLFGTTMSSNNSDKISYLYNLWTFKEAIISNFDNATYSANVEVGIAGLVVDRKFGYPYVQQTAGTFYTETEFAHTVDPIAITGGVHSNTNGYKQEGQGSFNQILAKAT